MKFKIVNGDLWHPHYAVIDMKEVTIKLLDGSGTPNELEIECGEGNFTWTEKIEREYRLNRGILDEVRDGDQQPVEISFDVKYEYIKGTTGTTAVPTVEDFLKQINAAAAYVSADADLCAPYAVDLTLLNTPGCGENETLTFADFRYETLEHDVRAGTISCSGRANIQYPTSVRA